MPFNGSGVFSVLNVYVPGTTIFSSAVNANFTDIANGLSTTILKDGTQTITANIAMSGFGFTGVASLGSQAVVTVASAATTDVLAASSLLVAISGTATITSFGADAAARRNQIKFVRATGAFTLTHNSTSLILPGGQNIVAASGDTFVVISDASSNARIYAYQRNAVPVAANSVGFATGLLYGMTMVNGTDATNDINFAAGVARDSTDVQSIIGAALVKQLDATWAAGTNAGGRMSAAGIANTTYHCFAIYNPTTFVADYGFDTSATAPTLPSGYTLFRRIGSIIRESAAIVAFSQNGDIFWRSVPVSDVSAANPGTAAVTRTLAVPIGIVVQALIDVGMQNAGVGGVPYVYLSPLVVADNAAGANTGSTGSVAAASGRNTNTLVGPIAIQTNTSGQIRSRLSYSDADVTLTIVGVGWIDTRGRLS